MKSKKLVSLFLAALMTVSVGIQPAFAAGDDAGHEADGDGGGADLVGYRSAAAGFAKFGSLRIHPCISLPKVVY